MSYSLREKKTMPKLPNLLEINKYHQLHHNYHMAKNKHVSLKSQGKYCPPDILNAALKDRLDTYTLYRNYKSELWPESLRKQWSLIKFIGELF